RVPFTWDFSFLLCNEEAWENAKRAKIPKEDLPLECIDKKRELQIDQVMEVVFPRMREGHDDNWRKDWKPLSEVPQTTFKQEWPVFLAACKTVAASERLRLGPAAKVSAFSLAADQPDSMDCLILEIWLSEILTYLSNPKNQKALNNEL